MTCDSPAMATVPILHHAGVSLRAIDLDRDLAVMQTIFGDAGQMLYMLRPALSEAETRAQLTTWNESPDSPQWTITGDDDRPRGRVTLVAHRRGVMEVGIQVAPAFQGQGLARRAICAVTLYGLDELGLGRVFADIDPDNHACIRTFERAGYRREGHLVANWATDSGYVDSLIYAATAGWQPEFISA